MVRFWLKNLVYIIAMHLILILVFLNSTQILKVSKLCLRKNITWTFLVRTKYFYICIVFRNFINILLDEDLISLHQKINF